MKIKNISWLSIIGLIAQASIINGLPSNNYNNNNNGNNKRSLPTISAQLLEKMKDDPNKLVHHRPHNPSQRLKSKDEIDNIEYLDSLNKNELYDPKNIYNNTYNNPIYYLNQVNKYVKHNKLARRSINTIIEDVEEEVKEQTEENEFFEFGKQLDGFSLFVYETLIDMAFSATRGVKLSTFYYYGVNFFDVVTDSQMSSLISTGYSAL
ncbi:hypothetical protein PIROE2DRAFT_59140 [Piromyces sp. E2]|nr:hypothetical protein PIROE2DRAFT_59140 [Piromyces sp. E2]|eukprot:OUM66782.1 hypothetical protein PIROE2DRAFT_59140 [Piromyces sp. E2]